MGFIIAAGPSPVKEIWEEGGQPSGWDRFPLRALSFYFPLYRGDILWYNTFDIKSRKAKKRKSEESVMELQFRWNRKLPTPEEIKSEFPLRADLKEKKAQRDQ